MSDDLVKRLREKRERFHDLSGVYWSEDMLCQEAADRIEADAKRIAELEEVYGDCAHRSKFNLARADAAEARIAELEAAANQARLALAGYVLAQSAINMLDAALGEKK